MTNPGYHAACRLQEMPQSKPPMPSSRNSAINSYPRLRNHFLPLAFFAVLSLASFFSRFCSSSSSSFFFISFCKAHLQHPSSVRKVRSSGHTLQYVWCALQYGFLLFGVFKGPRQLPLAFLGQWWTVVMMEMAKLIRKFGTLEIMFGTYFEGFVQMSWIVFCCWWDVCTYISNLGNLMETR